jgi:hypothetical protein
MSTKTEPGQYDCYAKLAWDEPYFVLRAKDPAAPGLVEEWVKRRRDLPGQAGNPKFQEALACAEQMRTWRATWHLKNQGQLCGCDPAANYKCALHGGG